VRIVTATLLLLLAAQCVDAAPEDPAANCKKFWVAVNDRQYPVAWSLLSEHSKQVFCSEIAAQPSTHLSTAQVHALFDKNDKALVNGFWSTFHDVTRADIYATGTFSDGSIQANRGDVKFTRSDNPATVVQIHMLKEGGQWHVGYAETFVDKPAKH
jgi:hypothetical protein